MRSLSAIVIVLLSLLLAAPVAGQDDGDQAAVTPGGTLPGEPSIQLVKVAGGLADPLNIAHAGDGSERLFVVERIGRVRVIDADGRLLDEPFLDISGLVKTDFLEQGLLGLAFHPDYAENGRFYVYFAHNRTNGALWLVEYAVSADDPNVADPDSARPLVTIMGDPYRNHNGGTVRFGPDGYLYWTTGDGGAAGDPYENAQNLRTWFGKIFRIDVDGGGDRPYAIPEDNPFAQASRPQLQVETPAEYHPGAVAEIWAYGLRNPWQFHFDPETGDLYMPDVGQNAWEEINVQAADAGGGQNYGWDWLEGSHCYPETVTDCPRGQVGVLPVAEISHAAGDCSISGLGIHRAGTSAALDGIYFTSDFCSGRFWGLARQDGGGWVLQELLDTELAVTGGGNGEDGQVFVTSCNCEFGSDYDPLADPQGAVWRIVSSDELPEGAETPPPEPSPSPSPGSAQGSPAATQGAPTLAASSPAGSPSAEASPSPVSADPAASMAPGQEATVTMMDIAFEPSELTLPADARNAVSLPNEGAALHTFVIEELAVDVEVPAGETGQATIVGPPGTYEFICDVPGHAEAGMVGTLTLE